MEEDAGKLVHDERNPVSYVDYNRTGVPLIEIVSEPDMRTPEEASSYLKTLHSILVYLRICDGNMEEGSFRCDANVSVRPVGTVEFGTKTELKNMNSFKNVQKGLHYEINRHTEIVREGGRIIQETRLFDPTSGATVSMRSKEQAHDYRYFPDPDLLPLRVDEEWITEIKNGLPELPAEKKERFIKDFGIPPYDAGVLTASRELAEYFEEVVNYFNNPKLVSNWIMTEFMRVLKADESSVKDSLVKPAQLAELLRMIEDGKISGKIAKTVFDEMWATGFSPDKIVLEKGLLQVSDTSELESIISKILDDNPAEVKKYLDGKTQVVGFFVGQVMKASKGKANPGLVNKILSEQLSKLSA
jgi:aspartyl-tRNA(Asn)/glutamyl-tRNA(Gln) amidotransferase subunit B